MKNILTLAGLFTALMAWGQEAPADSSAITYVTEFNLSGPFAVASPFSLDTVDVNGAAFDEESLFKAISHDAPPTSVFSDTLLPSIDSRSVGVLSFFLNNSDYLTGSVAIAGTEHYKLFVDGEECDGNLKLSPEHHAVAIKFLSEPADTSSIIVAISTDHPVDYTLERRHPYMVHDLVDGRRVRLIRLSADGAYATLAYQTVQRGGESQWEYELRRVKDGRLVSRPSQNVKWMPRTCAYIEEEWEGTVRVLYAVSPATGERRRLAAGIPEGDYAMSPTEDYLIISQTEEGPKEDEQVFQVLEMDDRQPGWRTRCHLLRYDLTTGMSQRLTFGVKDQELCDISQDGQKLLITTSRSRLEKRPTTVSDFYVMDARTLAVDTLLRGEGFLESAFFSPDGRQLIFKGTPEAFDRIGCVLPSDVTPSMTEHELFLYDLASRRVTPLTHHFDPSVEDCYWSAANGLFYFTAEDRDYVNLFVLNPKTGTISKVPVEGDYTYHFDMAAQTPVVAWLSYKTMEPASAYVADVSNLKPKATSLKTQTFFDGRTALGDAELGTCQDWNYQNSKGDTVYGRLYLPKDFDATKKYPMIVYYYGGCSPVSRYFESPYAPQLWNSLGYVAYIVEPSGATGFGQEWASRHVNTAGRGIAEDIIEGVKHLCEEKPFINKEKIGCMGASYGGFMTQYLQTVTDIFAAAVSHAGITNHTSYWGEGYWGYNYSEVAMANSYPWSHRQLYVDQSPLCNADKIHTPLLLLHGTADTNVPIIESLQMFTALKLLGREVALVEVEGEDHHVLDYGKKLKWIATQMAWFQRWLKDDPSWWDALYPKRNL